MNDLKDALDVLYEMNELRDRAKELREQGRHALKVNEKTEEMPEGNPESDNYKPRERWIRSSNSVEAALLMKVLNHRDLSENEAENDGSEAGVLLKKRLADLKLKQLIPISKDEAKGDRMIPVLVAARVMQAMVTRSHTVFSKTTMLCYYRIVRELYIAAPPDWTIGAARAGTGGSTSAFITGECIRAIFSFEDAIKRTVTFFQQTDRLLGRHDLLDEMLAEWRSKLQPGATATGRVRKPGNDKRASQQMPPIEEWADRTIERMWFDWYISTNPRHGNMALQAGEAENQLLFHPTESVDMEALAKYKEGLREKLKEAVQNALSEIIKAEKEIGKWEEDRTASSGQKEPLSSQQEQSNQGKELRDTYRAESAHKFAFSIIKNARFEATTAMAIIKDKKIPIKKVLDLLGKRFEWISYRIHRVIEPAKRYIRTVLHREVAASALGRFDAGELVFAASSFGAVTNWQPSELLTRACALLVEALPESGRLPTTRPFHSTLRGHRMLPIGCEMTRSLAQLLQQTGYEIEPKVVRRMLNIFEDKLIVLDSSNQRDKKRRVAWNFEGSPNSSTPCVWVTAVSVLAIDRVVRMLNERINSIIFKYFEVIRPEKPHSPLTLNDLVYPDYEGEYRQSIALRLEQMRAHAMRVTLPGMYINGKGEPERVFSAIFHGPPGTGKTTLVEALALSSGLPLIRLSPSDLVVQGPAAIEGRARTVFEALSMLTQVVIILDEFEDVVGLRGSPGTQNKDIFEFLRTGMLPKLVKLHDAAQKQSLVYCLATNHLDKIDPAAKRTGRFDFQLEVNYPDALSRAGTLLYRMERVLQKGDTDPVFKKELNKKREPKRIRARFLEVVKDTDHIPASSLAGVYFRWPGWAISPASLPQNYEQDISFLWYVLTGQDKGYNAKKKLLFEEKEKAQGEKNPKAKTENRARRVVGRR